MHDKITPAPPRTVPYGPLPDQVGDLYLPPAIDAKVPVICLLHGGFWRMPWGRDYIAPFAEALVERGYAVWNLEYRRVGAVGGGWPGTLQDVGAGLDHVANLVQSGVPLDIDRISVVGHSAGGHLALWSAKAHARRRAQSPGHAQTRSADYQPRRVRIAAAVGLAPVADLVRAYDLRCGNGAVGDFLGGSPQEHGQRYAAASPASLAPLGVRQLIVHGIPDEDVPVELSQRYVTAARGAGDEVHFIQLPAASHMEMVNPLGPVPDAIGQWLLPTV